MELTGRCYCGAITYRASGDPAIKVQCHCRECQYLAGGSVNYTIGMPEEGFAYTRGEPARFKRPDLPNGVTREFCPTCGTQILTRAPALPGVALIKVGTLDTPEQFAPDLAIFTAEKQPFHHIPEGLPAYEGFPG